MKKFCLTLRYILYLLLCTMVVASNPSMAQNVPAWQMYMPSTQIVFSPFSGQINQGLQTFMPLSFSFSMNNSILDIGTPFSIISIVQNPYAGIAQTLNRSFNLYKLTPREVSSVLENRMEKGITAESHFCIPLLRYDILPSFGNSRWNTSIESFAKGSAYLPGGLFTLLFSPENGLQPGNTIRFAGLGAQIEAGTEIRIGLCQASSLAIWSNKASFAWGISMHGVIGHSLLRLETPDGTIAFSRENVLSVNGKSRIITAGLGLGGIASGAGLGYIGKPVCGYGLGFSPSMSIVSGKSSMSITCEKIGVMVWTGSLDQASVKIDANSLSLTSLVSDSGILRELDFEDFSPAPQLVQSMETTLRCAFRRDLSLPSYLRINPALSLSRNIILELEIPFVRRMAGNLIPRVGGLLENVMYDNRLKGQIGWNCGGVERYSSLFQLEYHFRQISIKGSYQAFGGVIFIPRNGMAASLESVYHWNHNYAR